MTKNHPKTPGYYLMNTFSPLICSLGSKCECAYCPSLWQASCYLPVPSSMENCNSKIGHFIMKICFPSNIPLRPFILRASFELDEYCSAISQYQLTCLCNNGRAWSSWKQISNRPFNRRVFLRESSQAL